MPSLFNLKLDRRLGLALALAATFGVGCAPLRTIDGTANNVTYPEMGATNSTLLRLADAHRGALEGALPSPREISNVVCEQSESIENRQRASDMVWQWGQFLDHDLDLTDAAEPHEPVPIAVPTGDLHFDPFGTGTATISFNRSAYVQEGKGREQINRITSWIDASNVYGSDSERAKALRALDGTGRLALSEGGLLPFNTQGLPNEGGTDASLFLAGDPRANEQVYLTAMHTLWAREHNRWADEIRRRAPRASGDEIYEAARIVVNAELQIITYQEFLPVVLGKRAMPKYRGYDPTIDSRIGNEFSTAAFRFGHSMLSPTLLRLDRRGQPIEQGHLALRDAFFSPARLVEEGGIAPLLRGLASQQAQNVDPYLVDDVRNFLFGPPGSGGFDLAALNLQRGRDHGLPSYNDLREAMGLSRARAVSDISTDPEIQRRLAEAYPDVDQVEAWVGGLAEDHVRGALVGPLIQAVLVDQFTALRDGDRFWYARVLPRSIVRYLERSVRLSDVIRRNTEIGRELPSDVFHVKRSRAKEKIRRTARGK